MSEDRTGQRYRSSTGRIWKVSGPAFGGWRLWPDWDDPWVLRAGGGTTALIRSGDALDEKWSPVPSERER